MTPRAPHWFEEVADHLGSAYLRYSFTKGTANEVDFLLAELGLRPGARVLDVGCGPGRHVAALRAKGIAAFGVDISASFVRLAAEAGLPVVHADGRALPLRPGSMDAAISLCQGGFGLPQAPARPAAAQPAPMAASVTAAVGRPGAAAGPAAAPLGRGAASPTASAHALSGPTPASPTASAHALSASTPASATAPGDAEDRAVLAGMAAAVRPGGLVALSAFSAYFQVRYLEEDRDSFDAAAGINHERTEVRSPAGEVAAVDLWTACYTPRELRLLCDLIGLEVVGLWSVGPGDYERRPPVVERPELLVIARRM